MAYYATARIFADPFGAFLEGQRQAAEDVRRQQELLRRMYETYLAERRIELGYADLGLRRELGLANLDYKNRSLESLDTYRQETLGIEKQKLKLREKELNQPSPFESYLQTLEALSKKKKKSAEVGVSAAPAAPEPPAVPKPQDRIPVETQTAPKRIQDRIPVEAPPVTTPPTSPQSALPPVNGVPQAAQAPQRVIGGFTLPERAAQQLQQAPATTPVPNPLAAYRDVKERQKQLPAPVPPPTGGFTQPPANRPPGGRKFVYDRIPVEAGQAATQQQVPTPPAAQNTQKITASVERLLSLRQEIVKQLQNPTLSLKDKRALAAALARVDSLLGGGNAR